MECNNMDSKLQVASVARRVLGVSLVVLGVLKLAALAVRGFSVSFLVFGGIEIILGVCLEVRKLRFLATISTSLFFGGAAGAFVANPLSSCDCLGMVSLGPVGRCALIMGCGGLLLLHCVYFMKSHEVGISRGRMLLWALFVWGFSLAGGLLGDPLVARRRPG
jgi:hypothetical protein